ncbi:hypothetical protein [Streptomyces sp. KL116D]|uniref:hypothetical protein n=1 Tax=Streptomyces sp. KL116D TaxID=3045152 RepID=UPI00355676BC
MTAPTRTTWDVPAAVVEANVRVLTLAAAASRTNSPSDALAFRLDEWLVTHPDAVKVDADPAWDHHIAEVERLNEEHRIAAEFNRIFPVGTPVIAYPGARPEDIPTTPRLITKTRSKAVVRCGSAVVWVEGHGAWICLTHIDIRTGGAS